MRKVESNLGSSLTRSVILVHNDLGYIRSRNRPGCAVLLVSRRELFVRNRANLLIIALPVVPLLEDEFLPVDQPTLLDRPVVLLPVSFGSLLGRSFGLFLLFLPLGWG